MVLIFHAFSVFATLSPRLFLIPLEPISLSSTPAIVLLLGGSCSARQNTEHSSGALALLSTFSSRHLPRRSSCLAFYSPPPPPPPTLSLSSPFPVPFPFPLSFSLSLVVDWVSECLWQLCVVCNRAERLV